MSFVYLDLPCQPAMVSLELWSLSCPVDVTYKGFSGCLCCQLAEPCRQARNLNGWNHFINYNYVHVSNWHGIDKH